MLYWKTDGFEDLLGLVYAHHSTRAAATRHVLRLPCFANWPLPLLSSFLLRLLSVSVDSRTKSNKTSLETFCWQSKRAKNTLIFWRSSNIRSISTRCLESTSVRSFSKALHRWVILVISRCKNWSVCLSVSSSPTCLLNLQKRKNNQASLELKKDQDLTRQAPFEASRWIHFYLSVFVLGHHCGLGVT